MFDCYLYLTTQEEHQKLANENMDINDFLWNEIKRFSEFDTLINQVIKSYHFIRKIIIHEKQIVCSSFIIHVYVLRLCV